jgi:hypothetical protein
MLPVLAEAPEVFDVRPLSRALPVAVPRALVPAVQAAAAAAGGFIAGAAVLGLVHRHQRRAASAASRRLARPARRRGVGLRPPARRGELVQIVGSRSVLVDVHLLSDR